jgi:hypothetical protein
MAPKRAPRKEIKASPPAKKAKSAASGRKPAKQGESTPVQMEMLVAEVTKRVLEGLRAPTQVVNEQQSSGDAATGVLDNAVANLSNQLIGGLSGISSPRAIQTGNALPVAAGAGQCGGVVGTQSGSVEAGATSGLGLQQATMDGFALGSSVAASLRGKIMADEYINLGLLLYQIKLKSLLCRFRRMRYRLSSFKKIGVYIILTSGRRHLRCSCQCMWKCFPIRYNSC